VSNAGVEAAAAAKGRAGAAAAELVGGRPAFKFMAANEVAGLGDIMGASFVPVVGGVGTSAGAGAGAAAADAEAAVLGLRFSESLSSESDSNDVRAASASGLVARNRFLAPATQERGRKGQRKEEEEARPGEESVPEIL
jgi:hypothetical protein